MKKYSVDWVMMATIEVRAESKESARQQVLSMSIEELQKASAHPFVGIEEVVFMDRPLNDLPEYDHRLDDDEEYVGGDPTPYWRPR